MSPKQSILVYKKKNHYNEWEFLYSPLSEQGMMPNNMNNGIQPSVPGVGAPGTVFTPAAERAAEPGAVFPDPHANAHTNAYAEPSAISRAAGFRQPRGFNAITYESVQAVCTACGQQAVFAYFNSRGVAAFFASMVTAPSLNPDVVAVNLTVPACLDVRTTTRARP